MVALAADVGQRPGKVVCLHTDCGDRGCVCPCHSTTFFRESNGEVTKVGLGYQGYFPADGVELRLERVRESRGEIHGELSVRLRDDAQDFAGGHLFAGNFNASSLTARKTTAAYLRDRLSLDWAAILERFCLAVLRGERLGNDFQVVGQMAPRPASLTLMDPILPLQKPTIIFGQGGTGKSTLAGAIAVSTATGREVVPGWQPTPGAVLFLDWEEDEHTWNDRFRAIAAGAGIPAPNIHYRRMSRPLAEDIEPVAAYIREQGVLLLIVDAVGLAVGSGREGESWNDGTFRLFEALRQFETTTLLIDHVASSELQSSGPASKPFGSIYKVNLARSVFELRAEREGSGERTELLMVHSKCNGPKLRSQGLAIIRDETSIRFERSDVDAPELVQALSAKTRMERALRSSALPTKALAEAIGVPEASIRSVLNRDQRGSKAFTRLADGRIALRQPN